MGMKTIKATYEHTCDNCGCEEITVSRKVPMGWGTLVLEEPLYCSEIDIHGAKTTSGISAGTKRDDVVLCADCFHNMKAILSTRIKSMGGDGNGFNFKTIHIVFDGPPGARFIEVEDESRKSISVGSWHDREDGGCELTIPRVLITKGDADIADTVD